MKVFLFILFFISLVFGMYQTHRLHHYCAVYVNSYGDYIINERSYKSYNLESYYEPTMIRKK